MIKQVRIRSSRNPILFENKAEVEQLRRKIKELTGCKTVEFTYQEKLKKEEKR